jgi:transposase-like protein
MDEEVKRWTAKRKSALVLEIIQGKTTIAEASRAYDLAPSEVEAWVDDGKRVMQNALRANPLDVRGAVRAPDQRVAGGLRRSDVEAARTKKAAAPVGRGREVIETIHQGLREDGLVVPVSKLCKWLEVPRRTAYYKPTKATPRSSQSWLRPSRP